MRETKLVKLYHAGWNESGRALWRVQCACGKQKTVLASNVIQGYTRSCGCGQAEAGRRNRRTHGMSKSSTYSSWSAMQQRCKKNVDYVDRVRVCKRWLGKNGFANFLEDMGERPDGLTLDRKNNALGYCPSNCRWATHAEQNCNTRGNVLLTYKGRTQCTAQWARELGLRPGTLRARMYRGWPLDRILSPSRTRTDTCLS